jgi:hypothetical protein
VQGQVVIFGGADLAVSSEDPADGRSQDP